MIILGFQGGVTGVVFIDGAQSSRLILLQEGRRGARANIESDIDNTLQGGGHRPAFRVSKVFFISFFIPRKSNDCLSFCQCSSLKAFLKSS